MDVSLWVASLALFWLILLAFAWIKDKQNHIRIHEAQRKWLESLAERLRDIEGRMKSVNAWEDAMTGAQIDRNIEVDAIRERIDALSARLDAAEKRAQTQELKQDTFEHRTRGWQEGYAETARDMHRRLDERLTKLEVQGE